MPDVRDLLRSAARVPADSLELDVVARRADELRRHQRVLQAGCAALALVIAVPVGLALADSEPASLRQVPGSATTTDPTTKPSPSRPAATRSPAGPVVLPPLPTLMPQSSPRPTAKPTPTARPTTTPSRGSAEFPAQPACRADTSGLLPGQERSCRFTATEAGGWRFALRGGASVSANAWEVLVERDGITTSNPGDTGGSCANAVIQPGDRVTVVVRQDAQGYSQFDVGAGSVFRCGSK